MDNIGPNGDLDNDKMVGALLTKRNTPDYGCKLSPAQILFGKPLRDALPYIDRKVMLFNNPLVNPQWKDAWNLKEGAMKVRYVKTMENLSEHAHALKPLRHGDHVFIQNQTGRFPKKWDKSGLVVETKENDQYVVTVAGTGRLTLRNRRFLRRYTPHLQQGPHWGFEHPAANDSPDTAPYSATSHIQVNVPCAETPTPMITESSRSSSLTEPSSPATTAQSARSQHSAPPPVATPLLTSSHDRQITPRRLLQPTRIEHAGPVESIMQDSVTQPPVATPSFPTEEKSLRKSSRMKYQKRFYDPTSGTYVTQNKK